MRTAIAIVTHGRLAPTAEATYPPLDAERSLELARAMLDDIIEATAGRGRRQVVVHPEPLEPMAQVLDEDLVVHPQRGTDDLDHLIHALDDLFEVGYDHVVAISARAPTVDPRHVDAALERLATVDVVLGPARAGGYTMVASRQPVPDLLTHGSAECRAPLSRTVARGREAGLDVRLVAPRHRISSVFDYQDASVRGELHHAHRTVATMERHLDATLTGWG